MAPPARTALRSLHDRPRTPHAADRPLIPRAALFGNPSRSKAQISPDGRFLAWLAPEGGVLNIWVAPTEAPDQARPVTDDRLRGIRLYAWAYDGRHLVYLQDTGGNEDYHLFAVDHAARVTRDLTPFAGVRADIAGVSRVVRDRALVNLNQRDPAAFDLVTVDLATGDLAGVAENRGGFASFIADEHYQPGVALRYAPDGALRLLRRAADGADWCDWIAFSPEDARTSAPTHLSDDGTAAEIAASTMQVLAGSAALNLPRTRP
jgi:hypothetical protein